MRVFQFLTEIELYLVPVSYMFFPSNLSGASYIVDTWFVDELIIESENVWRSYRYVSSVYRCKSSRIVSLKHVFSNVLLKNGIFQVKLVLCWKFFVGRDLHSGRWTGKTGLFQWYKFKNEKVQSAHEEGDGKVIQLYYSR